MIIAPVTADAPIGVYIHVPFCAHICPYCDFTTYAGKQDLVPAYVEAVEKEIQLRAGEAGSRSAATIYLGGGTPSLLTPVQVERIIIAVRNHLDVLPNAEITMEANPNGLSRELLAGYLAVGVNRLSIGAQTLDRRGLRTLGRQHESTDVLESLALAREVGFERLNLDFIFGWPGQTRESWQNDLHTLVGLGDNGPDHLSLYSLIVEPGTPYADAQARGILHMPDDDVTADLYEDAISILAEAGWDHYEIANWCRQPEGYSRHNAIYWQHGDYLGIGAGAFGTMNGRRVMNQLLPERYINELALNELPQSNTEVLDEQTALGESMMLGLRMLNHGVNASSFAQRHGVSLEDAFGEPINRMMALGMMESTGVGVRLTHRGMMLANSVVTEFL